MEREGIVPAQSRENYNAAGLPVTACKRLLDSGRGQLPGSLGRCLAVDFSGPTETIGHHIKAVLVEVGHAS